MNTLQNLHQHSTFCDGKNTPEEIVLAAIDKGFDVIGFNDGNILASGMAEQTYAMVDTLDDVLKLL